MTGCSVLTGTDASVRDGWNAGVPGRAEGRSSEMKIAASRNRTMIKRSIFCARWRFARRKESRSRLFKLINFPPWKLIVSLGREQSSVRHHGSHENDNGCVSQKRKMRLLPKNRPVPQSKIIPACLLPACFAYGSHAKYFLFSSRPPSLYWYAHATGIEHHLDTRTLAMQDWFICL